MVALDYWTLPSNKALNKQHSYSNTWAQSELGRFLEAMINKYQVVAGIRSHVLQDTHDSLPHSNGLWLNSVWAFLHEIGGPIQLENAWIIETICKHDSHIMDTILQYSKYNDCELWWLNNCHTFLCITTITSPTYWSQWHCYAWGSTIWINWRTWQTHTMENNVIYTQMALTEQTNNTYLEVFGKSSMMSFHQLCNDQPSKPTIGCMEAQLVQLRMPIEHILQPNREQSIHTNWHRNIII